MRYISPQTQAVRAFHFDLFTNSAAFTKTSSPVLGYRHRLKKQFKTIIVQQIFFVCPCAKLKINIKMCYFLFGVLNQFGTTCQVPVCFSSKITPPQCARAGYNQARNAKHGTGQFLSMHILRDIYILQKNAYSGAHLIMQPSRKKNAQGLKNVQVQRAMKYEASLLNSQLNLAKIWFSEAIFFTTRPC